MAPGTERVRGAYRVMKTLYIHEGPKEDQNYMLKGQMDTTFWAFRIYFYIFWRWSKGQTEVVGRPDLAHENPCTK